MTAGDRGGYPLLLRLDGMFRWVAGMLAMGFGCLERVSDANGEEMEARAGFRQKWGKVFVVGFKVCGGRFGLLSGGLERWRFGELLGVVWEDAVDCGEKDCGVGSVGCR